MKKSAKSNSNDPTPEGIYVGQILKSAREDAGLTQEQLAAKLGWVDDTGAPNQKRVSHYECGRRKLSVHDLLMIAGALNASIDQLFGIKVIPSKRRD